MKDYSQIYGLVKADIDVFISGLSEKLSLTGILRSKLEAFLEAPAKRIRPLVAILLLRAKNYELDKNHYKLLTAIELVHSASLIHDDVIDDAEIRRNERTINKLFDSKLAVIAGDYLLSCAMDYVKELDNNLILDSFTKTLSQMCKGEFFQYFSKNKIPTMEEYLLKTENKTAKLFITAVESSFILSGLKKFDSAIDFAKNFGMAFQIKDDLKNVLTTNSDIESGIYNAPVILSGSIEDLAIEKTADLLNNYVKLAQLSLRNWQDNVFKRALLELTELYKNE